MEPASRSEKRGERALARRRRKAEEMKARLKQRMSALGGVMLFLAGLTRLMKDSIQIWWPFAAIALGVALWKSRAWHREYRAALVEAGIDPENDDLVLNDSGLRSTLLILFGVFGGIAAFLAIFISLARR